MNLFFATIWLIVIIYALGDNYEENNSSTKASLKKNNSSWIYVSPTWMGMENFYCKEV